MSQGGSRIHTDGTTDGPGYTGEAGETRDTGLIESTKQNGIEEATTGDHFGHIAIDVEEIVLATVDATDTTHARRIGMGEATHRPARTTVLGVRGEVKALHADVEDLKQNKISALPEMADKLSDIDEMLAQLTARVAQPVTIDYTVSRGDNLWTIAKQEKIYADPYMWPRLYRANKDQIQDPDLIFPDQTLAVPFGVAENEHLVTRGDFLFRIAAEVYNDGGKWHKIYEANKQQIVEPHLIFPAQILEIPSN